MQTIVMIILALVGGGTFLAGLYQLIKIRGCEPREATIVDQSFETSAGDHGYSCFPIYEYLDQNGQPVRARSNTSSRKPIGTQMTVYLDANGKMYEKRTAVFLMVFGLLWIGALCMYLFF